MYFVDGEGEHSHQCVDFANMNRLFCDRISTCIGPTEENLHSPISEISP